MGRGKTSRALRRARLRVARFTEPVLGPFRSSWRSSLMLRTMTITGIVTGIMVMIAGVFLLTTVRNDLYSTQRDRVLEDAARATLVAQENIDAFDTSDQGSLASLVQAVIRQVQQTTASEWIYLQRQEGQPSFQEINPGYSIGPVIRDAVSDDLSAALLQAEAPQYWQPVSFTQADGSHSPGIVVGSSLSLPSGAGVYDLYIGYDFGEIDETVGYVERTLLVTAAVMMGFIGILVLVMTRIVFRPIRVAADTSRRLAAGEADARMPLQNDVHFDTLSDGFNEMADTLQARIEELDQLSAMQQRFVSDVSHELRTPLTTIRLASEVLSGHHEALEPGQQRAVEVLSTQIERFESLLADLLEISRYDAGRVTLETEETNLVRLVEEVVEGLQPLSPSIIEVRALGGYAPMDVDGRRIRRIVSNLVGNAIEHGEGHPIVVTIDSNTNATAIGVRDWGIGMDELATEHVFDRFWRADPSRKRTLGGTGLGLAIAREDAAVHGGILEVWSAPGEGSHFRLTLPRNDEITTYVSPIPLVPEDAAANTSTDTTGGWLKRPFRRIRRTPKGARE